MRTLKFYGVSDDLFECEGTKGSEPDEIGCYDRQVHLLLQNEHGGLIVVGEYSPALNGCWMVGVTQRDEDDPIPDWPMKFTSGEPSRGYSVVLTIEVPDSVAVEEMGARVEAA